MQPKVWILGELNADIIMSGRDVIPEFNKEKLVDGFQMVLGSSSAITACVLAGLGAQVTFIGVVGDDDLGRFVKGELEKANIDISRVTVMEGIGTGVTLSLSTQADRALLTYPGSIPLLSPALIPDKMYEEADHIHFGSYYLQEGMKHSWQAVFRKAREAGITTSFDTGWDPAEQWHREDIVELLSYTDYFIPSEVELQHIFGIESIEQVAVDLPTERGDVIVKCGSRGCLWLSAAGDQTFTGSFRVAPVDTTGAGDSFNAGYLYARLIGYSQLDALKFANASGALAVLRVGGAGVVPTMADILAFIESRESSI